MRAGQGIGNQRNTAKDRLGNTTLWLQPVTAMELSMMDFIMLAIGLAFFAVSVGYCYACDRL